MLGLGFARTVGCDKITDKGRCRGRSRTAAVLMIVALLCTPATPAVARELPWPARLFKIASSPSIDLPIQDVAETRDGRLLISTGSALPGGGGEVYELQANGRLRTIAHFPRAGGGSGTGLLPDSGGSLLVADGFSNRILRLSPSGASSVVAGTGVTGFGGDGGAADKAAFDVGNADAVGLTRAADGSIVFTDVWNNRIRRIAPDGVITTIAGTGPEFTPDPNGPPGGALTPGLQQCPALSGDRGPATRATLCLPTDVMATSDGSLWVSDSEHWLIRRIDPNGTITTVGRDIPRPTSLAQLPTGDVLFGSFMQIGQLSPRGGRYRPFLTFADFEHGGDPQMVDFGGRGIGAGLPVTGLAVTREGGVLFSAQDAYYLAPRRTTHTLLNIRNARVSSHSAAVALLATRAGRATVEITTHGRTVARTSRHVDTSQRWLSVNGNFAPRPYEVRLALRSPDGGAAHDAIVLYLGVRLQMSHARALARQDLDEYASDLAGCQRITSRRVDCWTTQSVTAFTLRRTGHVYARSYRCTRPERPVQRRPHWLGPPAREDLGGLGTP